MANVFIEESTMTNIGKAIRSKTGKTSKILPADMPEEILNIVSGGDFSVEEVTLASDHSTQEWKDLCTIPALGQLCKNERAFAMLVRKSTTELTYSIPVVMACNSPCIAGLYTMGIKKTSYGYGTSYNATDKTYSLTNPNGKSISRIYLRNIAGNVRIYPEQSYSFVAGTYVLIYGVL